MILEPAQFHVSRSLRKTLRAGGYEISLDRDFRAVIRGCAAARSKQRGSTWITPDFLRAYSALHDLGWAHSIEVWIDGQLAGGLYGVALGGCFFGESMFSSRTDGSKIAFASLSRQLDAWGFSMLDCQAHTDHLAGLGARAIPRVEFLARLARALEKSSRRGPWVLDADLRW